jgi:hypothetical protein
LGLFEEQRFLGAVALGGASAGEQGAGLCGRGLRGEHFVEVAEFDAEFLEADFDLGGFLDGFAAADGDELGLRFAAVFLDFLGELLACSGDGVALAMDELFNAEDELDIFAPVEALAGSAFGGAELRELFFPETQDIGFYAAESSGFSDAEVEFVRNDGDGGKPVF